jgi:hypothetical protein
VIEKLKDKNFVRAFGLMSPKEQEYLREVGKENLLVLYGIPNKNGGVYWKKSEHNPDVYPALTYAIKPGYKPGPEPVPVDLEIVEGKDGFLGVYNKEPIPMTNFPFVHIHCLLSLPNFKGFYIKGSDNVEVEPQWVARHDNVIARFRSA